MGECGCCGCVEDLCSGAGSGRHIRGGAGSVFELGGQLFICTSLWSCCSLSRWGESRGYEAV